MESQYGKKIAIIGCGIAGAVLAMALQKSGISCTIYESQSAEDSSGGWFLYLGPNGMDVFKILDMQDIVRKNGYECKNLAFENKLGIPIAQVDTTHDEQKYGSHGVVIKRSSLHKLLRKELESRGIQVAWNKQITDIKTSSPTTVFFKDQSSIECDYVIGCDGLYSQTRKIIMPDAPSPRYSGNVLAGAITPNQIDAPANRLSFHYGKRAYMVYFVTPEHEALWGAVIPVLEKKIPAIKSLSYLEWKEKILSEYEKDADYFSKFIQNSDDINRIPLYDIESLHSWYKGNVCLVGDSAHAMTPHAGQGASMALESAVILAKCIRDIPDTEQAFAKFQELRKPRVEHMILQARKQGKFSTMRNPVMKWFRAKLLPMMIKLGSSQLDEVYNYKTNWDEKIEL